MCFDVSFRPRRDDISCRTIGKSANDDHIIIIIIIIVVVARAGGVRHRIIDDQFERTHDEFDDTMEKTVM